MPGSLKIHTKLYTVPLGELRESIDNPVPDPLRFVNTRRWLPKGEAPYPGYCRAPGSGKCIPALCNCQKLKQSWNKVVLKKIKQKNMEKKGQKIKETEKKTQEQKEKKRKV